MRLPTVTARHAQLEDARALNERIYRAFTLGTEVLVGCQPMEREKTQLALAANGRHFWGGRGFRMRTAREADGVRVWLEPLPAPKRRSARRPDTDDDLEWRQPA